MVIYLGVGRERESLKEREREKAGDGDGGGAGACHMRKTLNQYEEIPLLVFRGLSRMFREN